MGQQLRKRVRRQRRVLRIKRLKARDRVVKATAKTAVKKA